jgi:hypothetical protein
VEQKSRGKSLDGAFQQALDYFHGLAERDLPQIIIDCDFAHFRVHHLATNQTTEFALKDLHKNIKLFGFIAGYKALQIKAQDPVNIKAAERMGKLHDALKASGYTGHPLEVLLVRLLFCLFADDTGIFQPSQALRTFIEERTAVDGSDLGSRLAQLFQVLNTPEALLPLGTSRQPTTCIVRRRRLWGTRWTLMSLRLKNRAHRAPHNRLPALKVRVRRAWRLFLPIALRRANRWACCGVGGWRRACISSLRIARSTGATKRAAKQPCIA